MFAVLFYLPHGLETDFTLHIHGIMDLASPCPIIILSYSYPRLPLTHHPPTLAVSPPFIFFSPHLPLSSFLPTMLPLSTFFFSFVLKHSRQITTSKQEERPLCSATALVTTPQESSVRIHLTMKLPSLFSSPHLALIHSSGRFSLASVLPRHLRTPWRRDSYSESCGRFREIENESR